MTPLFQHNIKISRKRNKLEVQNNCHIIKILHTEGRNQFNRYDLNLYRRRWTLERNQRPCSICIISSYPLIRSSHCILQRKQQRHLLLSITQDSGLIIEMRSGMNSRTTLEHKQRNKSESMKLDQRTWPPPPKVGATRGRRRPARRPSPETSARVGVRRGRRRA